MISSFGPGNIESLYLIPFDKGHYNIVEASSGVLDFRNFKLPVGYGVMKNLYIDAVGQLRARPTIYINPLPTAPTTKRLKFLFSNNSKLVAGWDGENVKVGGGYGAWGDILSDGGAALPLTSNSVIGNQSFALTYVGGKWIVYATTSLYHHIDAYKSCVAFKFIGGGFTPKWAATAWNEQIEVVGADENRIFYGVNSPNGPIVRYSERQDPDTVGELSWFYIPNPHERFADMINVGNTLYIITAGGTDVNSGLSIYKKVLMGKSDDLIDMTSFNGVFSNNDISIMGAQSNPKNAITSCLGSIYIATQQFGLCQVTDQGLLSLGMPMIGDFRENESSGGLGDFILASDERYGLVLCGRYGKGTTHVFDVVKRVWYEWPDFEVACRGYGTPERCWFGLKTSVDWVKHNGDVALAANNYIPAELRNLQTQEWSDYPFMINFRCDYYTGQLDFGHPFTEKQLRHIYIDGAGIEEVNIYSRNEIGEEFTLLHNITSDYDHPITGYIPIDSQHRWKEIYIHLNGGPAFKLQHLAAGVVTLRDYQWGF